jgi:hypothetical protein
MNHFSFLTFSENKSFAEKMNSDSKSDIASISMECTCIICEESFDENAHRAIVLSCGHTFGKKCALPFKSCQICKQSCDASLAPPNYMLEQFIDLKKRREVIICKFDAELGSELGFILDFYVNEEFDSKEEEEVKLTEKCMQCNQRFAESFCVDCDVFYCKECDLSVHKFKVLANHLPRIQASVKPKIASDMCSIHKDEELKFVCNTCDVPVCRDCKDSVIGTHNNHKLTSLNSALELSNDAFFDQVNSALKLLDSGYEEANSSLVNARLSLQQLSIELIRKRKRIDLINSELQEKLLKYAKFQNNCTKDIEQLKKLKVDPLKYFLQQLR